MVRLKIVPDLNRVTNDMTIEQVAGDFPPPSWEEVFEKAKLEIQDISEILEQDKVNGTRFPENKDLFRAFWNTPLQKVKVVIFGQDPYPSRIFDGRPQATGMSFSVPRGTPIPSSLRNIYKEIKNTVDNFEMPSHGDLTKWASQGILLLNSSLSVREKEPGSHKQIWDGFIKKIINTVLNANSKCIFIAWGKHAQNIAKKFVGEKGTILEAVHPSGLSANRGFFGCNHFVEINNMLITRKKTPIDWTIN